MEIINYARHGTYTSSGFMNAQLPGDDVIIVFGGIIQAEPKPSLSAVFSAIDFMATQFAFSEEEIRSGREEIFN